MGAMAKWPPCDSPLVFYSTDITRDIFIKPQSVPMKKLSQRLIYGGLIGLPIASLLINAVSWLRFGLDLPLYDDWRGYASGQMHSLDLEYLFHPVNDTMTPIGFALDALAQRYLDGNSIAYQFLSMVTVLGGLLLLQWRLLQQALGNTRLAAICFVFTLLMIQPDSYWGQQNMAYHQALPLLFILSSLTLLLSESAKDIWRMPLILTLSLLAGFSYISGAFGVLAVGLALLLVCSVSKASALRKTMLRGGVVLTMSGIFSSGIQYWRAIHGFATHKADVPMALPTDLNFWLYFLGKIGRSLALPQDKPSLSLAITILVCIIVFALILGFAARHRSHDIVCASEYRVGIIFFVIGSLVFIYLLMVSAGRTNMHPPEANTPTQVFQYGFYRFHYFWATLLWPWLAAAFIVTWQALRKTTSARMESIATVFVILLIPLMSAGGIFAHAAQYKAGTLYRMPTVACLAEQVQRGEKIFCPEFFMPDFRAVYAYSKLTGASFVRHYPILPIGLGVDDPSPWFRLTRDKIAVTMRDVTQDKNTPLPYLAGVDAQMLFKTGKSSEMAQCLLLDVNVNIQVKHTANAQIFYRPRGNTDFSEQASQQLPVLANNEVPQQLHFQIPSTSGFDDALRFDPVSTAQQFNVLELEVRCRWSLPTPTP